MKFYIDIMKWQRPERSGVLAVLLAFTLLGAYGDLYIPHEYTNDLRSFSLTCFFFPWMLSCEKREPLPEMPKEKLYHVILLHPGLRAKQKIVCTCHLDLHYFDKPIIHVHGDYMEQACDSDYTEPRDWTEPPLAPKPPDGFIVTHSVGLQVYVSSERIYEMNRGQGEYRYHCLL